MKRPGKIIVICAFLALISLGAYRIWQAYERRSAPATAKAAGASRVVSVEVDKARSGTVRQEVLLTGSLKPKEQVDVVAKATGRLVRLLVHVGDRVNAGDLIAELEDDEVEQQVNRAIAAQAVAAASAAQREAELSNAKSDLNRQQSLFDEGLISRRDLEAQQTAMQVVQSQLQLARAQERQAQAELNELKIQLQQTRIYAPMAGSVARRYVDPGALLGPSTPIINLVNLSVMVTVANVPERDIGNIRVGNTAIVKVDAFGGEDFQGRVVRISPVLDAATRSASVEVEIPNRDGRLKAEMFARVMLDLATFRESVLIPREALVYRGQQPGVYIPKGNQAEFRPIETGLTQGEQVEVLANLLPGTSIVTSGATMLGEGDEIRVAGGRAAEEKPE